MSQKNEENYRVDITDVEFDGDRHIRVSAQPLELDDKQRWVVMQSKPTSTATWRGQNKATFYLKWRCQGPIAFDRMDGKEARFILEQESPKVRIFAELHQEGEDEDVKSESKHLDLRELRELADVAPPPPPPPARHDPAQPIRVTLTRTAAVRTKDRILSTAIRYSTESVNFSNYVKFIDYVLCGDERAIAVDKRIEGDERGVFSVSPELKTGYDEARDALRRQKPRNRRLLTGTEGYRALRDATDWFLKVNVGVLPSERDFARIEADLIARVGSGLGPVEDGLDGVKAAWDAYTANVNGVQLLPYLNIIRNKLADVPIGGQHESAVIECSGLLQEKLQFPCFIELIWSYWQEEGMLAQTINAIVKRFQNRRAGGSRDPLVGLEIDPLRPLNNLLWGYVQDELSRLSVVRRAHEYQHHYGLGLEGLAVARIKPADRRSKFIEAFHNFMQQCHTFYQKDDQTTVIADGFPVLNAIKEVHYLLAQGAHNQFGDMPSTARAEMLIQQWLLGRPEMREFLGGRTMVPYPEPWMDRVDAMKTLQGWTDTSVVHFNDLATFGEQVVLGLRYGAWSIQNDPASAANFARDWRAEIQAYAHAYRAVTGVDIAVPVTSQQSAVDRNLPPSVHLLRRLAAGKRA